MTISSNLSTVTRNGNGVATSFSFPFKVWDTSQLDVFITDPAGTTTSTSNFTATLSGSGGNVVYPAVGGVILPTGWAIVINRNMPFTQSVDLVNGQAFYPDVIEQALDELTATCQQLDEGLSRSVKVDPGQADPAALLTQIQTAVANSGNSATAAAGSATSAAASAAAAAASATAVREATMVVAKGTTTPRSTSDRFADIVNIKDFGATGDGVHDDTEAFKKASAAGIPVFVPYGNYYLSEDVSGVFYADGGVSFTGHNVSMLYGNSHVPPVHALAGTGAHIGFLGNAAGTNFQRALQSIGYDRFDNVVYITANYGGEGTFVYAYQWDDLQEKRVLLGTNYDPDNKSGTAFYDAFAHQGMGVYRPSRDDEPLLVCARNQYESPDVTSPGNMLQAKMIRWDYNNPNTFETVKIWQLFDSAIFDTGIHSNISISPDGNVLMASARRTDTQKFVYAFWDMNTLMSLPAGENGVVDATGIVIRQVDDPYGTTSNAGQASITDGTYIYCLNSGSDTQPHYVYVYDMDGREIVRRAPSIEGSELFKKYSMIEGECLAFLPYNGKYELCMGVSVIDGEGSSEGQYSNWVWSIYALTIPLGINEVYARRVYPGETGGDSASLADLRYAGVYSLAPGSVSNMSGGAWTLQSISDGYIPPRQIFYRGNTTNDVRTRVGDGEFYRYVFHKYSGDVQIRGTSSGSGSSNNTKVCIKLQNNYDDYDNATSYGSIERYRSNSSQGGATSSISMSIVENNVAENMLVIGASFSDGIASEKNVRPATSRNTRLGTASALWSEVFSSTGSINTSDADEKQNIEAYPDAVLDAWGEVELRQFLFKDAVANKGEAARIHAGVIAQQVIEAFSKHNLDATKYGLLCYDEWPDQYETVEVEDSPAVFDTDGTEIAPQKMRMEQQLVCAAGCRYGIRYTEALCLEAAYQRRRADRVEERLAAIEAALEMPEV